MHSLDLGLVEVGHYYQDNSIMVTCSGVAYTELRPSLNNPDILRLFDMVVDPEFTKIGLGGAMFDHSIRLGQELGFKALRGLAANPSMVTMFDKRFPGDKLTITPRGVQDENTEALALNPHDIAHEMEESRKTMRRFSRPDCKTPVKYYMTGKLI